MTDEAIYNLWFSKTDDLRYLRPKRWKEIKRIISEKKVVSVLEFGSGVSTLLFDNLRLTILSLETNARFLAFVKHLCSKRVVFRLWNNRTADIKRNYDFSLVDGIVPRDWQLKLAMKHARIVAIDDFNETPRTNIPSNYTRIDDKSTTLAVFERNGKH